MLKPDKQVVKEMKAYCKDLDVLWNNEKQYFEVWIKMPWGKRLVTPVVESLYKEGGSPFAFAPLDRRILPWIYSADSQRRDVSLKWKWLDRQRFMDREARQQRQSRRQFMERSLDAYNIVKDGGKTLTPEESDWVAPDVTSRSRNRVMARSAENVRRYFDDVD